MKSKLSALQTGDVALYLALMKDGTAVPIPKAIMIGVDRECEEIYVSHLNMHPVESKSILDGIIKEME